jgi:hypothetical protein
MIYPIPVKFLVRKDLVHNGHIARKQTGTPFAIFLIKVV